jgi:hypothetical protein
MNLLTVAPLYDSKGKLQYFIGGQVDVSGLCKDATNLESLRRILKTHQNSHGASGRSSRLANGNIKDKDHALAPSTTPGPDKSLAGEVDDAFQELSEMFSDSELEVTRCYGGRITQIQQAGADGKETPLSFAGRPRLNVGAPSFKSGDGFGTPTSASFPRKSPTGLFQHASLCKHVWI